MIARIGGRDCALLGERDAPTLLLQPVDARELADIGEEAGLIRCLAEGQPFLLAAFPVKDWNDDLSPWPAPPVFGDRGFGGGAAQTLRYLKESLLPALPPAGLRVLGGYSLAGLFALWAACGRADFDAVAAASPSVWYPGWLDYARAHPTGARRVYLSLGDRESRARNPVMARVGDAILEQRRLLEGAAECTLEWNPGNHFRDSALRTAKAFAWAMRA